MTGAKKWSINCFNILRLNGKIIMLKVQLKKIKFILRQNLEYLKKHVVFQYVCLMMQYLH